MKKRILSMILAIAMIASLFTGLSFTASAEDYDYIKVTDASGLAAGDVLLLVCEAANAAAGPMGTGKFFTSQEAAFSGNVVTAAAAIEITLGGEAGAWTLTTSEGEIGTSAAKALNHTGSGTLTWTIGITDGNAAITSTNTACGSIQYNESTPRFLNYTSNQTPVQLYKKTAAGSVCTHPNISYTVTTEPTCTEAGERSWSCPDCGQSGTETIPALGHAWGEGTVTTAPTCTAAGEMSYACTRENCDATKTETVAALGHVDENADNVCDRCGVTLSTADTYVLASSIREGDKIMFVFSNDTVTKAAGPISGNGTSTYLSAKDAAITGNTVTSADALIFDVEAGTAAGTFAFKNDDAYLTPSATGNYTWLSETVKSENTDWTVSIANGVATVAHPIDTDTARYLKYNVSSPRFSCYLNGQSDIAIYKLATEEDLVDVYFVDQDDNANAFVYAFGSGVENAPFPGEQLTAQGVDENGDNYYKITLDRNVYTNVIFSGGGSETQTANLGLGAGAYIVYYISGHTGYEGADVWPAPGTVVEPTCTEPGCTRFVGLLTGVVHETNPTDPTGHA